MSYNVATQIGSGTLPYTRGILPAAQRGNQSNGEGIRTGMQVVVANPEDINSVDAFAVSGISIGVTPVQVWGPELNSLPRQRTVILVNDGPNDVYIGPNGTSVITPSGMRLPAPAAATAPLSTITLPLMSNVQIWARSLAGGASIRILAY